MSNRKALLLGTLPFEDEETAIDKSLSILGKHLICVPDGEIGEKSEKYPKGTRSGWVCIHANECAEDTDNWEVIQKAEMNEDGFPAGYDKIYTLRSKHSPEELPKYLNLHFHEYFYHSYPIFQRLRKQYGYDQLKFQLGIPTGFTLSVFIMEPENAIAYYPAFQKRLLHEVNEVLKDHADDIVVQLELPIELGLVYQTPSQIDFAMEIVMGLVKNFQYPTQIGIHLCCGDLNNEAWTHPESLEPLVTFANRLIREWPKNQEIAYIHVPLAEGNIPPTLEKDFYQPLARIQLPKNTELFAGFVHEGRTIEELHIIHSHVENICNRSVGVACACGMGRRSPKIGEKLMKRMKHLLESPPAINE